MLGSFLKKGGVLQRRDWLLVALAGAKGGVLTPVQLQKSLFLLGRRLPQLQAEGFYIFLPHHYGPFCVDIYRDAEELEREHLVEIVKSEKGNWKEYKLTAQGKKRASTLRSRLPSPVVEYVDLVVQWTQSLGFAELVRKIYALFPEYRINSVFQR